MSTLSTLNDVLFERRATDRAVTFIEANDDHRRLSYEQLYLNSLRVLHDLQASDLSAGDQLIILLKDNRTFIEAFWACILGGIVPVPVAVGISDEHRAKLLRIFNRLERPYLFTTQADLERLLAYGKRNDMLGSVNVVAKKTILADQLRQHVRSARPGPTQEVDKLRYILRTDLAYCPSRGAQICGVGPPARFVPKQVLGHVQACPGGTAVSRQDALPAFAPVHVSQYGVQPARAAVLLVIRIDPDL